MAKNIVFCADGTWNGPDVDDDHDGSPDITNVLKLFMMLEGDLDANSIRLKDEQEKTLAAGAAVLQCAKYLHGVGDSSNPISRLLGGVFGSGVVSRVVRGYTFVSRTYQPGDTIYLVGFSRGAYTARALGGLISSGGLLNAAKFDLDDKEMAYALGISAWRAYREKVAARVAATDPDLSDRMLQATGELPGFARIPLDPATDLVPARIKAIGVWDTVGSLGVPVFDAQGRRRDVFGFADRDLSTNVDFGFHAVSLDEQRADFEPTLWNPRQGVVQRLFPGAHADVGGGYPQSESRLSDGALLWMVNQLQGAGARLGIAPISVKPDPLGTAHQPWLQGVFALLGRQVRQWPPQPNQLVLDDSVRLRMRGTLQPKYQPTNLL